MTDESDGFQRIVMDSCQHMDEVRKHEDTGARGNNIILYGYIRYDITNA